MNFKNITTQEELSQYIINERVKTATLHPLFDKERSDALSAAGSAAHSGDMDSYRGYMSVMSNMHRFSRPKRSNSEQGLYDMLNDAFTRPIFNKGNTNLMLYEDENIEGGDLLIAKYYAGVGIAAVEYKFIWSDDGKEMSYINPLRVDIEDDNKLISLINSKMSYNIFKEESTALECTRLPFFTSYSLLKAKTWSTMPPVSFNFLWNDKNDDIIKLEGSTDPIFNNITKLDPQLTTDNALAYASFVLKNIWTEYGAMKIVESVSDIEFSEDPGDEELQFLTDNISHASIDCKDDSYFIECNVVYGIDIYKATICVPQSGLLSIVSEETIGDSIEALRTIMMQ